MTFRNWVLLLIELCLCLVSNAYLKNASIVYRVNDWNVKKNFMLNICKSHRRRRLASLRIFIDHGGAAASSFSLQQRRLKSSESYAWFRGGGGGSAVRLTPLIWTRRLSLKCSSTGKFYQNNFIWMKKLYSSASNRRDKFSAKFLLSSSSSSNTWMVLVEDRVDFLAFLHVASDQILNFFKSLSNVLVFIVYRCVL